MTSFNTIRRAGARVEAACKVHEAARLPLKLPTSHSTALTAARADPHIECWTERCVQPGAKPTWNNSQPQRRSLQQNNGRIPVEYWTTACASGEHPKSNNRQPSLQPENETHLWSTE